MWRRRCGRTEKLSQRLERAVIRDLPNQQGFSLTGRHWDGLRVITIAAYGDEVQITLRRESVLRAHHYVESQGANG